LLTRDFDEVLAVNRFTIEFGKEFCHKDGSINWEKLVIMNSGRPG